MADEAGPSIAEGASTIGGSGPPRAHAFRMLYTAGVNPRARDKNKPDDAAGPRAHSHGGSGPSWGSGRPSWGPKR
eukprot:3325371-Pyramimonas_sp.AAC.1